MATTLIDNTEDETKYVVQRIVEHEENEKGEVIRYKVHWKGYANADDSWVAPEDMMCPRILKNYHNKLTSKKGKKVDGKFHTWILVNPADEESDEEPVVDLSTTILDSIRSRARSRSLARNGTSSANVSFIHLFEAEVNSSDEETKLANKPESDSEDQETPVKKRRRSLSRSRGRSRSRAKSQEPNESRSRAKSQEPHEDEPSTKRPRRSRSRRSSVSSRSRRRSNDSAVVKNSRLKSSNPVNSCSSNTENVTTPSNVYQQFLQAEFQGQHFGQTQIQYQVVGPNAVVEPCSQTSVLPSIESFINSATFLSPPGFTGDLATSNSVSSASVWSNDPDMVYVNIGPEEMTPSSTPTSIRSSSSTLQNLDNIPKLTGEGFVEIRPDKFQSFIENIRDVFQSLDNRVMYATAQKTFPITYCMNDAETALVNNRLHEIVKFRDVVGLRQVLRDFRPCEINLNQMFNGQSLIMMCCTVDCGVDHVACDVMEALINGGSDLNASSITGINALSLAAANGIECRLRKLLRHGARTNDVNVDQETALFVAVRNCPMDQAYQIVLLLLSYGIDTKVINKFKQTALDVAYQLQKWQLAELLKSHIQRIENNFVMHIQHLCPQFTLRNFVIDFRCLEISLQSQVILPVYATQTDLPAGFAIYLFISGAEFAGNCEVYNSVFSRNIVEICFNGVQLMPSTTNSSNLDVILLQPWVYGENSLILKNVGSKSCIKVVVQANRVETAYFN